MLTTTITTNTGTTTMTTNTQKCHLLILMALSAEPKIWVARVIQHQYIQINGLQIYVLEFMYGKAVYTLEEWLVTIVAIVSLGNNVVITAHLSI